MGRHEGQAEAEKMRRYINPDYLKQKRAEDRKLQEKFDRLCGPVETRKIEDRIRYFSIGYDGSYYFDPKRKD